VTVSAGPVRSTDAAAVAHPARPAAARRPPYLGYVGPAAVGLRDEGLPGRDDVLDFGEDELYRNPKSPEDMVRRGSALALFIACTGATVEEIPLITYDPKRPPRGWIYLPGDGLVAARTVPLPELAAIALRHYRVVADKITKCDRLFVNCDGNPLTVKTIRAQFNRVGHRIGIAGARVPTSLRQAYIAWLDAAPQTEVAAYLRGYNFVDQIPPEEPLPSARRDLVWTYHPLGKLDREMLRWQGAVARRDAAHPMPELTPTTKKAFAAAKKRKGHKAYPNELKAAVRGAIALGHEPKAVLANYGVSPKTLHDYVPRQKMNPLAAFEDVIRAKLEAPRTPTGEALLAWLEKEHDLVVSLWKLREQLKIWGFKGKLGGKRSSLVDSHLGDIRATIPEGGVADLDIVVELLAKKGVTLSDSGLRAALHRCGIPLSTTPVVAFDGKVEVDVRAWISIYPVPSLKTICKRLEDQHGLRMSPAQVSARIKAMGVEKAKAANASCAVFALGPHVPAIKSYIVANPTESWAAIADWARANLGIELEERTLVACMHQNGINKMVLAAAARKSQQISGAVEDTAEGAIGPSEPD
jgi:transposase